METDTAGPSSSPTRHRKAARTTIKGFGTLAWLGKGTPDVATVTDLALERTKIIQARRHKTDTLDDLNTHLQYNRVLLDSLDDPRA
eukprot:gene22649-20464_t